MNRAPYVARMPGKNTGTNVVRIDTYRLTACEEDTAYPLPTFPAPKRESGLSPMLRAIAAAVGSMAAFAVILACWPN